MLNLSKKILTISEGPFREDLNVSISEIEVNLAMALSILATTAQIDSTQIPRFEFVGVNAKFPGLTPHPSHCRSCVSS